MNMNSQPVVRPSRFTRFPIPPAWRQGAWKAKRHGDFQRRFNYVEAAGSNAWPFNCRYFNPLIMDPTEAMDLNARDTEYLGGDRPFPCIDFTGVGPLEYSIELDEIGLATLRNMDTLPLSGTRIFLIPQWRLYSTSRSTIQLGLGPAMWERLLTVL